MDTQTQSWPLPICPNCKSAILFQPCVVCGHNSSDSSHSTASEIMSRLREGYINQGGPSPAPQKEWNYRRELKFPEPIGNLKITTPSSAVIILKEAIFALCKEVQNLKTQIKQLQEQSNENPPVIKKEWFKRR